ncbi:hypothetical protein ACFVZN_01955 [Streptomyces virginiae]|uniref:hypothetical protein n=1 Tax=Streptomyces virginiae TaxID=1961 RepID=UPI003679A007
MLLVGCEEAEAREGIAADAPEGPVVGDAHAVRKGAPEGGELPYRDSRFVLVPTAALGVDDSHGQRGAMASAPTAEIASVSSQSTADVLATVHFT